MIIPNGSTNEEDLLCYWTVRKEDSGMFDQNACLQ